MRFMKIKSTCTIVALLVAAGCSHEGRHARYDQSTQTSGAYSSTTGSSFQGAANTENSSAATTPSATTSQSDTSFNSTASTTGSQTDTTLTTQIQQQIQSDPTFTVIAPQIQVTAQSGTVTLSGSVQTEDQKRNLEALVKKSSGVISVNNQIQVSQSAQPSATPSASESSPSTDTTKSSSSITTPSA